MITIQPAPHESDPLKLPYPYHIEDDGMVGRQDFWRGNPYCLLGFQKKVRPQRVSLHLKEFLADPQKAVGMYPVFSHTKDGGGMFNLTMPISKVIEHG